MRCACSLFTLLQAVARIADRDFGRAQLAGQAVALELVAVDLACDLPDLRLDGLQLSFGLLPIRPAGAAAPCARSLQEKPSKTQRRASASAGGPEK